MKRIILLILNALLCISVCDAQFYPRESIFYPYLDIIVINYYNYHFRYPAKVKELVRFTEYSIEAYPDADNSYRDNISMEILPYLKRNIKHILIEESPSHALAKRSVNSR